MDGHGGGSLPISPIWVLQPIHRIETPQGRSQYAALQKNFAARAKPLRERLLALTSHIGAEDLPPAEPWAVKPTSMAPA